MARSCPPSWSSTAAGGDRPCRRGWRRWGPPSGGGGRGQRLHLPGSAFPFPRRAVAVRSGAAAPVLRLDLRADAAGGQCHVVGDPRRPLGRSGPPRAQGCDAVESVLRSLPTVAHWIAGDPIEDRIITMAKIEDRYRDLRPDGVPVATGILAVADAWACTNPSVGRGVDRHAPRADGARHIAPHRAGSTGRALRGFRRGNGRHRRALVPSDPRLRPSPAGRNGRSGQGGALRTRRPRLRNERRARRSRGGGTPTSSAASSTSSVRSNCPLPSWPARGWSRR